MAVMIPYNCNEYRDRKIIKARIKSKYNIDSGLSK